MPPASSPAPASREGWVDAVKAVLIVLVVLHHAIGTVTDHGVAQPGWAGVDAALSVVRMPLFFVIAGLFAHKSISGPREVFWRRKVGHFVWLYAVWGLLYLVFFGIGEWVAGRPVAPEVGVRTVELLAADNPLWFLAALGVGFAAARAGRRFSRATQLAVAGVVAVALIGPAGYFFGLRVFAYPFFFLVGLHGSAHILAAARRIGLERACSHRGAAALVWLGRHTLPVYLLHVAFVSALWNTPGLDGLSAQAGPHAAAVVALAATMLSLAAWVALRRVPGLFEVPHRWLRLPGQVSLRSLAEGPA